MQVKILVGHAGTHISRKRGEITTLPDAEGHALIAAGLARLWLNNLDYAVSILQRHKCSVHYPTASADPAVKKAVAAAENAGVDIKPESKAKKSKG